MAGSPSPFTPSFGKTPPLLVGRDPLTTDFGDALDAGPGALGRSTLLTGARGMGKTVMLNALEDEARTRGWLVISEDCAYPGLAERLTVDHLPRYLAEHDPEAVQRRITGAELPLRGGGVTTTADDKHQPQPTLRNQLERLTDVLAAHETGVLITVDEIHGASKDDLAEVTSTFQHAVREDRDVAFVAAGLPSSIRELLNQPGLTFLRRSERAHLGPVDRNPVARGLQEPIEAAGRTITPDALDIARRGTHGYPFLVQLVGHYTWMANQEAAEITTADAEKGVEAARRRLGRLVHEPALSDLSAIDRTYLAAMAIDDGPSATRDIAARMGTSADYANVYRSRLIAAEVITAVRYGQVDFALPYLRDYLRAHAAADALSDSTQADPDARTPHHDPGSSA